MLDIGYSLSLRFPDSPATDYRAADVKSLRRELFCGDVHLADTDSGRELSTAWGWVPVLDFAWALCDVTEQLDRDPLGSRAPGPYRVELDFTESTDRLRLVRTFGFVDISADWSPADERPLSFPFAELRIEARAFLHDLLSDLIDMHEDLAENPAIWSLQAKYPRH
ncbi:hypothetical protein [Streptomyces sp. NPDC050560]|uniref:hypothetical protein n=1 Tax=Streptomyces sp. NPDC050560 TaxID=3365630 RepID=UPI0037BBF851